MSMITSIELSALTGLSYRQIDYWTRRGVLRPELAANGSGSHRGWSEAEAWFALLVCRLHDDYGMHLEILGRVGRQVRDWDEDEWTGHVFIDANGRVFRNPRAMSVWIDLDVLTEDRATA